MVHSRDSGWFFRMGEEDISDAKILESQGGSNRNVLRLLHEAVELFLKAAIISKGLWDGFKRTYMFHDIEALVGALRDAGLNVPPDLFREVGACACVPRQGEASCETHTETGYSDNLDWSSIPPEGHWADIAQRTRDWVLAEFPQLRP